MRETPVNATTAVKMIDTPRSHTRPDPQAKTASIGTTGATVVSRLGGLALPSFEHRQSLVEAFQYRRLFRSAERYWYLESWRRQAASQRLVLGTGTRTASQGLFRAIARGGRVVTGSDAPLTPYGLGLHAEMWLLTRAGLQPFQVLHMATLGAARALGVDHDLGSIEPGKLADLVIVAGDPLTNIADALRVETTVKDGRSYPVTELLRAPAPAVPLENFTVRPRRRGGFYRLPVH